MPSKPHNFQPPGCAPAPKRSESHDRYYGTQAWRHVREYVLRRDGYRCTASNCADPTRGQGRPLVVHHIVERKHGGTETDDNLRTLCLDCHNRQHPEKGGRGL